MKKLKQQFTILAIVMCLCAGMLHGQDNVSGTIKIKGVEEIARERNPDLFLPKDEFESTPEYNQRLQRQKALLKDIRAQLLAEAEVRKKEKGRLAAERATDEERQLQIKIAESLAPAELMPLDLGEYDADNEIFYDIYLVEIIPDYSGYIKMKFGVQKGDFFFLNGSYSVYSSIPINKDSKIIGSTIKGYPYKILSIQHYEESSGIGEFKIEINEQFVKISNFIPEDEVIEYKHSMKIPRSEARSFKQNYASAKVEGYKQLQRDLKTYDYFNMVVIHPITGSRFPFGPQKDIAELKYSEPVIAAAPDLIFKEPDFVDMDANQVLDAMESGTLSIKLLNRGDGTAKSVSLSVEVGDPALNVTIPQKFIGEIPPGQSRLITFDLLAGRDIDDGTVSIRIKGKEALGYDARPFPLKIPTAKLIPSQILIEDYFTINDGQTGTANGNNNKIPENGETIEVMLTVRNKGEGPAYGCLLTPSIASNLGALSVQSSIPLGLVAPKSFTKVPVALSIPKTYKKKTIDLTLHIEDERTTVDYSKNLPIESSFRQPELSFDYIVHDGTSRSSRGNQNGIIEKGEKIDLEIIPQNLGEYLAEDVAIDVKLDYVGIRSNSKQSLVVGKIPPQSNGSSVSYTFTVQHSAKLGRLTIDVRMAQSVFDTYEKELVFTIEEEKLETFTFGQDKGSGFGYFGDVEQDRLYNVDVAPPLTNNRNNNAYAVVIGNRTYGKGVPSVDYAERDARIFKSYLTRTLGFKESNIIYEIDADYGRFTEIFGKKDDHEGEFWGLAKNDNCKVIVYYSGHGAPDLDDGTGYFVPSGSDPNKIKLTGYSVSLLKRNLAKLPTDDITLLIDACFSGGSHREGFLIKDISPVALKLQDPEVVQGVSVFAASAKDEVSSWYPEARHGVFTYYFLAGLQGRADINQDSIITFSEMDKYLRSNVNDKVREISKGQRKQTPQLQTLDENRVLVRY